MNDYDDYRRTHGRDPSYEELKEMVERAKNDLREDDELMCEQLQLMRIALGEEPAVPVEKTIIPTCGHVLESNRFCGSAALKGRKYCRFHLEERGRRLKMARARARGERWRLNLPPLEDMHAVQAGIMRVLEALDHGVLEKGVGGLMLYGLQQAATNLSRPQDTWDQSSRFEAAAGEGPAEYANFEADYGLPQGIDVDTPPEVAFPEAQPAAISEEKANLMEVTALDVELTEIQQHEGPEAVTRKLKQLDAAEDRRYRHSQAQLAHARHVVRAAAQNAARETYFVERSQADLAAVEAREQAGSAAGTAAGAEGAPPLSASVADRVEEAGAPPLSASVADRVAEEPTRKEPQSASTATDVAAKASKRG